MFDDVVDPAEVGPRERYEAIARSVRDVLSQRWHRTEHTYDRENPKRVYYLSMEFLIGRSLSNNILNLRLDPIARRFLDEKQLDGLCDPRGGARRGARQWRARPARRLLSRFDGDDAAPGDGVRAALRIRHLQADRSRTAGSANSPTTGCGIPIPGKSRGRRKWWKSSSAARSRCRAAVCVRSSAGRRACSACRSIVRSSGYGGKTINTLRLWAAATPDGFDFQVFSAGEFVSALAERLAAESVTRVLYPDNSTSMGQALRFVQEYFLVACSLADLIRRFRRANADWHALPDKVAIQLNDTHPALAVPELMRILLDEAGLGWDEAWDLTRRTLAYTNHTLLPEALEKWPLRWFEMLLPRQLEIIYEINRRLIDQVRSRFPGDEGRVERVSLIEEGSERKIRMANLAIVGSHSTNGVAAIHSGLLRTVTVKDLAELFPERFNNKTNGVTPRRWLLLSNPELAGVITDAIGDGWITDLSELAKLKPLADDRAFRDAVRKAKRDAKVRFSEWLKSSAGVAVDPDSIFDSQVKRIHEYKRQLLNGLRIVVLYNRLRQNPDADIAPRTFFFAGKAAPAYYLAKLIIKFLNNLAGTIDGDPAVRGRLKVVFLPDYDVSLAERLIPASDVSNQISTAGYEASGTSNMKFMMNGALTIGTRDGATIEMAEAAGEENFFLFGLTAEQVAGQPRLVQPALALRQRAGNSGRARPDLLEPFQPERAGGLRAAARCAADARRPLHAPGGPDLVSRCRPAASWSFMPIATAGPARRS